MSDLLIKVSPRKERGKQNKKIRKNKWIPAVVYGSGQKNISFSLDIRLAEKYSKKKYENKIFTFESESKELQGLKAIKKAVSYHKVSHQPIHMDFLSLDMKKSIRIYVDINFKGVAKGVKEEGGVFNVVLRRVEVECLPDQIPPSIDVDISDLGLNQSIHVSDLNISQNVKLITKGERTLCTLVEAEKEEEKKESDSSPDEKQDSSDSEKSKTDKPGN